MTDYLSWRRAWLDWWGDSKGRREESAMLAGLEEEAGIQPAPQPNPSLNQDGGIRGDV